MFNVTAIFLVVLVLLSTCASAEVAKVTTYPVPDAVSVCPYSVTVNGQAIPIEKAGEYQGCWYARFEFTGTARAEVHYKATAATKLTLKPDRFATKLEGIERGIRFEVEQPGVRVITTVCGSKELWPVIIMAARPEYEPDYPAGTTIDVNDYLTRHGVQTAGIQKALDECAAKGGGRVVFGPGIYVTGPLFIKDRTFVHLQPGCLIKASTDPKDWQVSFNDRGSRSPGAKLPAIINFLNCKQSSIQGPGVVDVMGHILREEGLHINALKVWGSQNVFVGNVIWRNSASWNVHVFGSKDVRFKGTRILADWAVGNTDGINPDCSQDVTVEDYFCYCGDDGFAIKTTSDAPDLQGSSNITLRDALIMTRKTGFKIGTETSKDVSNVLIENCEAINTSRGIGIYLRDGATVTNVTYRNVKLDLMEYPGEDGSGSPFTIELRKRLGIGKLSGVTYDNVSARCQYSSNLFGEPTSNVQDVLFKDCKIEVVNRALKFRTVSLFSLTNCRNVKFSNCSVNWNIACQSIWEGFLKQTDCAGVVVEGLKETKPAPAISSPAP